ncbi:hypothetical protein HO173_010248 [Letharia columbiana]|uniref:Fe2OG dioxygenase domain-containing protein n=1 Tax=Letharia columbiana TaxID=112416 RepID=A0A8H6L0Z6_9LECA|nr:uncharacterized protein HO173_010248 [Letharia columbiana]KAF6231496.1 hypothetical protein HO173_010248 [Letharia columbiana]
MSSPLALAPTAAPSSQALNSEPELPIPLISLQPLLTHSPSTLETAKSLLSAFRTSGFLYLTEFSSIIPPSLLASVFEQSARFFARPQTQKDGLAWTTARSNRGYVCMGREKVSQGMSKADVAKEREHGGEDLKESFEIGREFEEGHENRWPDKMDVEGAEFKLTMLGFFERCKEVQALLMRGIALGMGLDAGFFEDYVTMGDNTLRLLHYPPVAPGGFEGGKRVRAGAHSDYGSVTLLFQDQRGGLQVERPEGWVDVQPIQGSIVVNAGDLLARWSNDLIRSTKHRVVEPPLKGREVEDGHPARYSVAYFCNPDFDKRIEALPGTWEGEKGGKKYEGVNSGEYLVQRLSATY